MGLNVDKKYELIKRMETDNTFQINKADKLDNFISYIIKFSDDAIEGLLLDGKIVFWNKGCVELFGYSEEEIKNQSVLIVYPQEEKQELNEMLQKIKEGKHIEPFITQRLKKNGELIEVAVSASPIYDKRGVIIGASIISRPFAGQEKISRYARTLIEASIDPLVTINTEGKITDLNEAMIKITGIDRELIIGTDFSNYFSEPDKAIDFFKQCLENGSVINYPLTISNKRGGKTDVIYNATQYKDEKGKLVGVFAAARDVTELKQASMYARSLIECSLDPLLTISQQGIITEVNEAMVVITGVSRQELIGSDFSKYFTDPDDVRVGYEQVFMDGFVREYPLNIRHISGKISDVIFNAAIYRDMSGKILGMFAALRDNTRRKTAEENLHAASAYARSLIESSLDPMMTINEDGKITDVNHATEIITGVAREWLIGSNYYEYFSDPSKARKGYRQTLKNGSIRDYSLSVLQASGKVIDVLFDATVFRDAKGKSQGIFVNIRDITEFKQLSQYARSIIEATLDPLFVISLEGKVTDVNVAAAKVIGLSSKQLINSDLSIYFTEPDKIKKILVDTVKNGFVSDYELTIKNTDGKSLSVLLNASLFKDEKGKIIGIILAARDFSRLKEALEQLKLINQDLDSFTYSVAHDLKGPLRAIEGFSNILIEDYSNKLDNEGKRIINVITANTQKMIKLVEDLLNFSHTGRSEIKKENVKMHNLVESVYVELKNNFPDRNINLKLSHLPEIKGDNSLLKQVWVNLMSNAIKFTQTKKQSEVEIGYHDADNEVIYYIKDNGVGFDMKYVNKLFGVFQRLHGDEFEGTGIGLANVKKIINRLHGKVWAEGKINEGATFYFSLPKG